MKTCLSLQFGKYSQQESITTTLIHMKNAKREHQIEETHHAKKILPAPMNIDRILTFQGNAQQNIHRRHFVRACALDTRADDARYYSTCPGWK